jgi:hypothetical protein
MSWGTLNRNICKDSWEIYFEINWKSYFYAFLARFSFWVISFYNLYNYSRKTKCANDLKFCTKISGLNLHQMVHLYGKSIFSPIMSKNLCRVPLTIALIWTYYIHQYVEYKWAGYLFLYVSFSALSKLNVNMVFYQPDNHRQLNSLHCFMMKENVA